MLTWHMFSLQFISFKYRVFALTPWECDAINNGIKSFHSNNIFQTKLFEIGLKFGNDTKTPVHYCESFTRRPICSFPFIWSYKVFPVCSALQSVVVYFSLVTCCNCNREMWTNQKVFWRPWIAIATICGWRDKQHNHYLVIACTYFE